jgi:hypothetical protein
MRKDFIADAIIWNNPKVVGCRNYNLLVINMNKKFQNNIMRYAFGWNHKAWQYPLKSAGLFSDKKFSRILEVGASRRSIVAIIFDGLADEIVISYYQDNERVLIENYLSEIDRKFELKSTYILEKIDAHTVTEKFDLVIMKSVLGGIFRENTTSLVQVESFVHDLVRRTVSNGGSLISIDNGKSFYDRFLSRLGSRKNGWRFFTKADLSMASKQFVFGVLSSFSFETRLGIFGHFLDNYIVYPLDWLLFKFFPNNPTVILRVFKDPEKCDFLP